MQAQIISHLCYHRFPNLYQKASPLTLAMKIFSLKVLRFTIQSYWTVDLMVKSNTAQKNRNHQEEGRTVPQASYGATLLSAEMGKRILKNMFSNRFKKHS